MKLDSYKLTVQADRVVSVEELFLFPTTGTGFTNNGGILNVFEKHGDGFSHWSYADHMCETMQPHPKPIGLSEMPDFIANLIQLTSDEIRQVVRDGCFMGKKINVREIDISNPNCAQ